MLLFYSKRWFSIAGRRPLKVVVGLSGGVDSSVTALLLKKQGFEVHCAFMKNWDVNDEAGAGLAEQPCPVEADWGSASSVASALGLPLTRVDFTRQYWNAVFQPMLDAYAAGRTPNPDTDCNRFIKFGEFRRYALETLGADVVATGHWAQLSPPVIHALQPLPTAHLEGHTPPVLHAAVDGGKDQSDFLSLVPRDSLRRVMFPLGTFTKAQARSLATAAGLSTAARKDSTGICFIGNRKFGPFLQSYLPPSPGIMYGMTSGAQVSVVESVSVYTPGQRARVPGLARAHYVAAVDQGCDHAQRQAAVHVVPDEHHPALYHHGVAVRADSVAVGAMGSLPPLTMDTRHESVQQDVDALADMLVHGSASSTETQPFSGRFPLWRGLLYRDRHRQEDLKPCMAVLLPASLWRKACAQAVRREAAHVPRSVLVGSAGNEFVLSPDADELVLAVLFGSPHRAPAAGQSLVLYAHSNEDAAAVPQVLKWGDVDFPPPTDTPAWNASGMCVWASGPIACVGPSLWATGMDAHSMPQHLREEGTGKARR